MCNFLWRYLTCFKEKGSPNDQQNYRPITLFSCLGKVFTSVLLDRLTLCLEKYELLCENQTGFRPKYSTLNNMVVRNSLIELFIFTKNKIFCAFIDFKAAFDKVWGVGLWQNLINSHISGKCLNVR